MTSAASATAQVIADSPADSHMIRLTDLSQNANGEMIDNDLDHGSLTDDLVSGIDAIINIGYKGQSGTDTHLMDYHTRCTYNLLAAASGAGVSRFINISTLRLYENHEENLVVTERWRTDPSAEDIEGQYKEDLTAELEAADAGYRPTVFRTKMCKYRSALHILTMR